jgi:hypothetical protein
MQKPIRKNSKLSKEALPERLEKLKEAYPQAKVQLWATDEHRLGLKPILRKVWSPKGDRPISRRFTREV